MGIHQWLADKRARLVLLSLGLCSLLYLTAWVLPLKDSADATFLGHEMYDYAGYHVAMVGDVNGDGYDDMLIGAHNAGGQGMYGEVAFLILGRAAPNWGAGFDLANADASFIADQAASQTG